MNALSMLRNASEQLDLDLDFDTDPEPSDNDHALMRIINALIPIIKHVMVLWRHHKGLDLKLTQRMIDIIPFDPIPYKGTDTDVELSKRIYKTLAVFLKYFVPVYIKNEWEDDVVKYLSKIKGMLIHINKSEIKTSSIDGFSVPDMEFIEFPVDDLDDEFTSTLEMDITISSPYLAKFIGCQQRVVETKLKNLSKSQAIHLLVNGPQANNILMQLKPHITTAIVAMSKSEFNHGSSVIDYEWDNQEYWEVKISDTLQFHVEVSILAEWK
jgi:CRISPR/Cas system-associated exonuclease Cas4 (RecB family)